VFNNRGMKKQEQIDRHLGAGGILPLRSIKSYHELRPLRAQRRLVVDH